MRLFFALITLTVVVCSFTGIGLAYDGSYYMYRTLEGGQPFVPNRRMIHDPLQRPLLLASQITSDMGALGDVFSVTYSAIPLIALLASWLVVRRRHRYLFLWPVFGICLATLPGQVAFIAEFAIISQLFWPILLALLVGVRWRDVLLMLPLLALVYFAHPAGSLLFAGAAATIFFVGRRSPYRRMGWLVFILLILSISSVVRFSLQANPYEAQQINLDLLRLRYHSAVAGLPLVAVLSGIIAGLGSVLPARYVRNWMPVALIGLMTLASGALIVRALAPSEWWDALSFRFFAPMTVGPFMALAVVDYLTCTDRPAAMLRVRPHLTHIMAGTFALSLSIQALYWATATNHIRTTLASQRDVCFSSSAPSFAWLTRTLLDHWTLPTYSVILQGRAPSQVIMHEDGCARPDAITEHGVRLTEWEIRGWEGGWFDFSRMAARWRQLQAISP